MTVKDSNGNTLAEGDSVQVIKDLKVKGSSETLKRGTVFTPDWGPRPWGWEPDRVLPAGAASGGCC